MKKALTLSIVIPVYNEQRHLKACLDAIAAQTVKPDEVIVVDNNSTDKSVEITQSYPFVKLLHEKKQGVVFARDKGFNAAKSDIIGRIDGDTRLPKDWVKRVIDFYQNPAHSGHALTGGGYFYNVRMPRYNGWVLSQMAFRMNRFLIGHYILWGSNMAFTKEMWTKVKNKVCHDNYIHEDLDLAIHLHRIGYQVNYEAYLRVGVYMKRLWEDKDKQQEHLERWPKTLHSHNFRLWWMSILGNILIKYIIKPFAFFTEYFSRAFWGRQK